MVKAKFKVDKIEHSLGTTRRRDVVGNWAKNDKGGDIWDQCRMYTIVMTPVYANNDPNHENSKFWSASPSGEIRLGTVNAAAVAQMDVGKEFYVTFEEAGK